MTLAERIAHHRAKAGLTQRQLADKLGLDCSAVAHWEMGDSRPRKIEALAEALGLTMVEFYSRPKGAAA